MSQETVKLTVRLPREDVEFAKNYAREHGMTVTEFIDRYLRHMRRIEEQPPSEALKAITGLVPADVDAREVHREHLLEKHRR